jgi:alpha-glucosidase (family GH31 glycosyl hydrolase)
MDAGPPMRALKTATQYEFLLGKSLLVAPVFRDEEKRDSIYLPAGKWFDYLDGTVYEEKKTLNAYPAPLEKLPVFVKAGSVIPMYPQMNYDDERPADTLTLDIYPGPAAEFAMIEDEGSNREYRQGKFATTTISASTDNQNRTTEIKVSSAVGDYKGKLDNRAYIFRIHSPAVPGKILMQGKKSENAKVPEISKKAWPDGYITQTN